MNDTLTGLWYQFLVLAKWYQKPVNVSWVSGTSFCWQKVKAKFHYATSFEPASNQIA